jgi:hypothetical protein
VSLTLVVWWSLQDDAPQGSTGLASTSKELQPDAYTSSGAGGARGEGGALQVLQAFAQRLRWVCGAGQPSGAWMPVKPDSRWARCSSGLPCLSFDVCCCMCAYGLGE